MVDAVINARWPEVVTNASRKSFDGRHLEALSDMPNYYRWIMDWFGPYVSGHVVEYGAGIGTVSHYLRPLTKRLTLVEPSTGLHAALRSRFPNDPLVEIQPIALEEHANKTESGTVSAAVLVNVLEHIEDDSFALSELSRILVPGGYILIFVPALPFLMSRLDTLVGHFRRYKRGELVKKLEAAGIDVLVCRYFDLTGILPWLIINKLLRCSSFNPLLAHFYDRVVVPLARVGEAAVAPPIGKNLIAIGRRPRI